MHYVSDRTTSLCVCVWHMKPGGLEGHKAGGLWRIDCIAMATANFYPTSHYSLLSLENNLAAPHPSRVKTALMDEDSRLKMQFRLLHILVIFKLKLFRERWAFV